MGPEAETEASIWPPLVARTEASPIRIRTPMAIRNTRPELRFHFILFKINWIQSSCQLCQSTGWKWSWWSFRLQSLIRSPLIFIGSYSIAAKWCYILTCHWIDHSGLMSRLKRVGNDAVIRPLLDSSEPARWFNINFGDWTRISGGWGWGRGGQGEPMTSSVMNESRRRCQRFIHCGESIELNNRKAMDKAIVAIALFVLLRFRIVSTPVVSRCHCLPFERLLFFYIYLFHLFWKNIIPYFVNWLGLVRTSLFRFVPFRLLFSFVLFF